MKKHLLLLYIIIFIPLTTACWNYREVDRLTIVTGFAVDKTDLGNYLLTFEVVDFHETNNGQTIKSVLIESEGETILSAIRNSINKNYPRLYFGHTTLFIISQEVARDGVLEVLDLIFRDPEIRLSINLFVSEEETAGEVLRAKALASELISLELTSMLDEQESLAKALPVAAYEFVNNLSDDGISGIITSVCTAVNNEEKIVELCGTAIFKEDKLQGFINDEDTFALSFLLDEVKRGVIVVNVGSETDKKNISLEILKNSTEVNPVYENNKLSIIVSVDTQVDLIEQSTEIDYSHEKERKELQKISEEQLKNKIESIINKIQREFGADIFGFGKRFYQELPMVWKEKGNEWDKLFRDLEVTVETKIEIKHTGLLSEPIKIGD